jgi:WD40 repeat protein
MLSRFSHAGALICVPSQDGTEVVSTVDWKTRFTTGRCNNAVFSPDDSRLIVHLGLTDGSQGAGAANVFGDVELWDVTTGKRLATLIKTDGMFRLATPNSTFSSDGRWIALGGNKVTIWDARTGEKHSTLDQAAQMSHRLIFSPDGKRLLVTTPTSPGRTADARGEAPSVSDVDSGKLLFRLEGLATTPVTSYLFSPDGKRIFTSAGRFQQQGVVQVWDGASGRELLSLTPAEVSPFVGRLELSPDGHRLMLVSQIPPSPQARVAVRQEIWDATPRKLPKP